MKKVPALPLTCLLKISKKIKQFVIPPGDTDVPPFFPYKISRSYNPFSSDLFVTCNYTVLKLLRLIFGRLAVFGRDEVFCRCAVLRRNDVTGIFSNALRRVKTQKNHLDPRPIRLCNVEIALSIVRLP